MKSCFITGMEARATGPTTRVSTGTSRQPMTFWLWYRTMSVKVFICIWRFDSSRERKHCATP